VRTLNLMSFVNSFLSAICANVLSISSGVSFVALADIKKLFGELPVIEPTEFVSSLQLIMICRSKNNIG
jgi:hypothetical protein